jgi:hypothetical protein
MAFPPTFPADFWYASPAIRQLNAGALLITKEKLYFVGPKEGQDFYMNSDALLKTKDTK